jgi:CheY-like chemotaxis protein
VYGIVRQNNGFIDVSSIPGQGTTFTLHFPRNQTSGLQMEPFKKRPAPCGHESILLVEDEPMILDMVALMLENLGYTVISARTPEEAIERAREHTGDLDLLLTDVVMPGMNGRDLAQEIESVYANLKVLFMSGYTADVIAHHGVLDNGVHFMQKPFSKETLGSKVREALAGPEN